MPVNIGPLTEMISDQMRGGCRNPYSRENPMALSETKLKHLVAVIDDIIKNRKFSRTPDKISKIKCSLSSRVKQEGYIITLRLR